MYECTDRTAGRVPYSATDDTLTPLLTARVPAMNQTRRMGFQSLIEASPVGIIIASQKHLGLQSSNQS